MGISQADIDEMKARAHEAGFGVNNAKAGAIRAEAAATADAQAGDMERIVVEGQEVMVEANASEGERRNARSRLDSDVQDANREAERSGTRAGRVEITGLGSREKETAKARAQKRAKEDARTQQLLALQAALEDRIAALDVQIGNLEGALGYLARTGDVGGTMEKPGVQSAIEGWEKRTGRKFDPNHPDAANTLKGIVEEDIKAKKEQKAEAEQEVQLLNDEIDQECERAEVNDAKLAEKNRTYEGRSETIDVATRADRKEMTKEAIQATSDLEDLEQRLLTLEDLAQFKGTPGYIEKIDEFIENAAAKTLMGVMADLDGDPDIQIRIGLRNLKAEIAEWDEYKGTPDYATYIDISVSEAPEAVREALENDPNLDEEVVAALYKPYSDTMDKPDKENPKSMTTIEDAEKIDVADQSTQRNPSTSSPGLG